MLYQGEIMTSEGMRFIFGLKDFVFELLKFVK